MLSVWTHLVLAASGNELTPTKAYTSLALFTLLRFPLAFLPSVIFAVINARVALNRIGQFLQSSEVDDNDAGFVTKGVPLLLCFPKSPKKPCSSLLLQAEW
jgi:hypothetical protein